MSSPSKPLCPDLTRSSIASSIVGSLSLPSRRSNHPRVSSLSRRANATSAHVSRLTFPPEQQLASEPGDIDPFNQKLASKLTRRRLPQSNPLCWRVVTEGTRTQVDGLERLVTALKALLRQGLEVLISLDLGLEVVRQHLCVDMVRGLLVLVVPPRWIPLPRRDIRHQ